MSITFKQASATIYVFEAGEITAGYYVGGVLSGKAAVEGIRGNYFKMGNKVKLHLDFQFYVGELQEVAGVIRFTMPAAIPKEGITDLFNAYIFEQIAGAIGNTTLFNTDIVDLSNTPDIYVSWPFNVQVGGSYGGFLDICYEI